MVLLQQRAPAIPGRQKAFAAELASWAKASGFAHLLLLCGLDAQYRREQQLEGPQLRFLCVSGSSAAGSTATAAAAAGSSPAPPTGQLQQLSVQEGAFDSSCSKADVMRLEVDVVANERELHGLLPPWPLLDACADAGVQSTLVATFAAEGDNAQDGMQLAAKVLDVLSLHGLLPMQQQQAVPAGSCGSSAGGVASPWTLKVPCSWVGLFGRSTVDTALF